MACDLSARLTAANHDYPLEVELVADKPLTRRSGNSEVSVGPLTGTPWLGRRPSGSVKRIIHWLPTCSAWEGGALCSG
jgi:hypothetical protein